jgi:eukaryotic-like serine/threonine-protein kinase
VHVGVCAVHAFRCSYVSVDRNKQTLLELDTTTASAETINVESPTGAPTRVGRYEVITHLATGGMAQIYLARIAGVGSFERHVVLKTILPERASDHRFVTMFLDEAKLAATLNHQNIAQVYEVDQSDGAYYMAMEFVHGENVRAILETTIKRQWTIPNELAMHIVSGAAAGLHHAHERRGRNGQPLNIVHRDVSPANIMVGFDGSVKVLDFGIAKAEERSTKTVGNTIKGKYGYMSPEQCKGMPLDRRSDIFALGIVLYELTTLRRAFRGNDDFETMKKIVGGELLRPSKIIPGYPMELEAIVMTALASKVEQRFQSGHELLEALDAYANRSKLTVAASAMARYMTQLFGDKQEPWAVAPTAAAPNLHGMGNEDKTRFAADQLPAPSTKIPVGNEDKTSVMGSAIDPAPRKPVDTAAMTATIDKSEVESEAQDANSWESLDSTTMQRHDARRSRTAPQGSKNPTPPPFVAIAPPTSRPSIPLPPPGSLPVQAVQSPTLRASGLAPIATRQATPPPSIQPLPTSQPPTRPSSPGSFAPLPPANLSQSGEQLRRTVQGAGVARGLNANNTGFPQPLNPTNAPFSPAPTQYPRPVSPVSMRIDTPAPVESFWQSRRTWILIAALILATGLAVLLAVITS